MFRAKTEILHIQDGEKNIILKLNVYHSRLWKSALHLMLTHPEKIFGLNYMVAIKYNADGDTAIRINGIKVADFETDEECKKFYEYLLLIWKNPEQYNIGVD
jgi:hypothetical protein